MPLTHPEPHPRRAPGAERRRRGDRRHGAVRARRSAPDARSNGARAIIAMTGTNGKSTTTALIGHILQACGFDAQVGGNIGKPVLDLASADGEDRLCARGVVLSDRSVAGPCCPMSPCSPISRPITSTVTARWRITPRSRNRCCCTRRPTAMIAVGVDDDHSAAIYTKLVVRRAARCAMPVSVGKVLGRGVFVIDGKLYDAWDQPAAQIGDLERRAASCRAATIGRTRRSPMRPCAGLIRDPRAIVAAILRFPGLAHRIEDVGPYRQGPLRQRFQGDQRRCRGARAGLLSRYLLDRRRQAEGRRHRRARAAISRASAKPI